MPQGLKNISVDLAGAVILLLTFSGQHELFPLETLTSPAQCQSFQTSRLLSFHHFCCSQDSSLCTSLLQVIYKREWEAVETVSAFPGISVQSYVAKVFVIHWESLQCSMALKYQCYAFVSWGNDRTVTTVQADSNVHPGKLCSFVHPGAVFCFYNHFWSSQKRIKLPRFWRCSWHRSASRWKLCKKNGMKLYLKIFCTLVGAKDTNLPLKVEIQCYFLYIQVHSESAPGSGKKHNQGEAAVVT